MAAIRAVSRNVREIRLHLCQTSETSKGVREFIEKHYVDIKQNNPNLPFLIRECKGVEPKLFGRAAYGKEVSVVLTSQSCDQVLQSYETVVKNLESS